ncbi:Polysaccharide biosynthesis protein [Planctomycetes bacterium K23_9]|uniref:Polysaccharide biosynthesis protein n=2 Tax=Stieleria marina TaxID=1930275 RepID=A0A517NYU7_9BACT|nr:Polysaccharide biosynthesis protein [Planctomycetes bacterium K23_9]
MTPERAWQSLRAIANRPFVKSVSVLAGGAAFAQALAILVLPVLTRLYSPDEFGVLGVFASSLGIFSVAACLRFEIAIPIPERDDEALQILFLAIVGALTAFAGIALVSLVGMRAIQARLESPLPEFFYWLLPVGVLGASLYNALLYWTTRKKNFSLIARTRLWQSSGASAIQVGLGVACLGPLGLVFGQLFNSLGGLLSFSRELFRAEPNLWSKVSWQEMKRLFGVYRAFPLFSTWEALVNGASLHLPILFLVALVGDTEVGFLFLALKLTQIPSTLIGAAIGQVYLTEAPLAQREGRLGEFNLRVIGGILKTGVGPLLFAGLLAPNVLHVVLGDEYDRVGHLVVWLLPLAITQLIVAPVSMCLHVLKKTGVALSLQIFGLILRCWAVMFPFWGLDAVECYAITGWVFYSLYLVVVLFQASPKIAWVAKELRAGIAITVFWGFLATLTIFLLGYFGPTLFKNTIELNV